MNEEFDEENIDLHGNPDHCLNTTSPSDPRNLSARNSTRTRSVKPQKHFTSDYQTFHVDEQPLLPVATPGDIIQMPDGTRKKYNGSSWRRLCSKPNCSYYTQSNGLCKPHLAAMKNRQSSSSSKDNGTKSDQETGSTDVPTTNPQAPKKGDVITLANGIRKKFDGRQYRRICANINCTTVVHGSLEYQNGMCPHHYHEYRRKSMSSPESSSAQSPSRKRRRFASPNITSDNSTTIPKANHRMNIATIPPTVDIQHPKKGDIIEMENGSRKKFDGVVWRKICSIPDCFIAAQRNELCRKHFIKLNGRPTLMSNHDRLASLTMVPPVAMSLSSMEEKSDLGFSMKDESQNEEEAEVEGEGECEEVIDQFSSLSDHEFHETNGHDSLIAEGEDSDAQLDHSLINSLSASREKFPTNHLKRWLREHRRHPYPTNQEKLELAQQSSITYDQVNTWFNNARAILRRRQAKLQHSFDTTGQEEQTERPESISFQDQPVRIDSKISSRIHRPLPLFNGVCCRSIGIQCHPSTVNQSTGVSDDISMTNDDELRHDRTIRILTSSTRNVKSPILKRRRSQEFLSNGTKVEHPFKDDTVVVTSTCLDDDQMARLREFYSRFNIEFRQTVDEHTTHLITDEEEGETLVCPLSKKVIQAVARHMYIVTYRWIDACLKSNEIVYEKPFEIQGDLTLSSDHHGMQRSRMSIYPLNLPRTFLMENYSIMIKCDGCQEMMNTDELIELVQLSGARYTTDSHFSRSQTGIIRIVLCEKEYLVHRQEMYEKCIQAGVHFLTPEWFLESLVQYRIQPFQEYQISP